MTRAKQAAKTKNAHRHISAACAATVEQLVGEAVREIAG
jgi:hypothetical protein